MKMMTPCPMLIACTVLLWTRLTNANYGVPPQIVRPRDLDPMMRAQVGENVKLECEVDDPNAFVSWTKDGHDISEIWLRHKIQPAWLRIKTAIEEDSGVYECRAVNGYGEDRLTFTLRVVGNDTDESLPILTPARVMPPQERPRFERPENMQPIREFPLGTTVRLRCHAEGTPPPQITWFKDGKQLLPRAYSLSARGEQASDPWTLVLPHVTSQDSGNYRCDVMNIAGSISFTYSLTVIQPVDPSEGPKISELHPLNTTVHYGDTATLQCRVSSSVPPTIQWLKRVERRDGFRYNNTIEYEGQLYVVLQTVAQTVRREDGLYLNKLNIPSATTEHAGRYICLGTNGVGFSVRDAFLTVISDKDDTWTESSSSGTLPVVLAVCIGVMFVIIALVLCCVCCRRRGEGSKAPPIPATAATPNCSTEKRYTALQPGTTPGHYQPPSSGSGQHSSRGGGVGYLTSMHSVSYQLPVVHATHNHMYSSANTPATCHSKQQHHHHHCPTGPMSPIYVNPYSGPPAKHQYPVDGQTTHYPHVPYSPQRVPTPTVDYVFGDPALSGEGRVGRDKNGHRSGSGQARATSSDASSDRPLTPASSQAYHITAYYHQT